MSTTPEDDVVQPDEPDLFDVTFDDPEPDFDADEEETS